MSLPNLDLTPLKIDYQKILAFGVVIKIRSVQESKAADNFPSKKRAQKQQLAA
jgi:hypothetical protein